MFEDKICMFFLAVAGVGILGLSFYFLGVAYSTWILRLKTAIEPDVLCRGDMAKVYINIEPQKTVNVSQITVKLECRRYFITRDSRGREHREEDVMAMGEVSIEGDIYSSGQARTITTDIMVPSDGLPTTVPGGNLYIKWFLITTFEIPSSFSAVDKKEIRIVDVSFKKPAGITADQYPVPAESKEIKICSACGVENKGTDKFCTDCGSPII